MNRDKHRFLINQIKSIVSQARSLTLQSVNALQVASNYMIWQQIVEFEQGGVERAEYGKAILKELSAELTSEFGKGYSHRNLDLMKKFYLTYQDKIVISQTLSAKLKATGAPDSTGKFGTLSNTVRHGV